MGKEIEELEGRIAQLKSNIAKCEMEIMRAEVQLEDLGGLADEAELEQRMEDLRTQQTELAVKMLSLLESASL